MIKESGEKVIEELKGQEVRGLERPQKGQSGEQSTTLPVGTVIITGTPAGVGMGRDPKETLKPGDELAVEILPHVGTLVSVFENEYKV